MSKKNDNMMSKFVIIIITIFGLLILLAMFMPATAKVEKITYTEFKQRVADGQVKNITLQPDGGVYQISGEYTKELKGYPPLTEEEEKAEKTLLATDEETLYAEYQSEAPFSDTVVNDILTTAEEQEIPVEVIETPQPSFWASLLEIFIFVGLMAFVLIFVSRRLMGGKNSPLSAGDNKARKNIKTNVTFADVIGYKEEKQELYEIIDFLKNPKLYDEMGAKIPNGVLLEGPPGTGKTLIAKAVAGEVGIPFYFISGSDFVEMYVGVGASRVRALFTEAKKEGRAIVFIDEIDAIGSRDSGAGGRNSEQEQTINQLLVELDGFASSKGGIIIIGATNRADKLDSALLRPGRFDRKIMIGLPQLEERKAILEFHGQKRNVDKKVDYMEIARATTGMSGAGLEAVINEGAILAVRDKRKVITQADLAEAIDRVEMGPAKISNKYSKRDKTLVSYHESGHAIIGLDVEDAMQVQKITIVPRRDAGGYVAYVPKEDEERFTTKTQLEHRILGLLGGRAAEEIFLGESSVGAHNDLERATAIARAMVTEFGMTDVGLYQYESQKYKQGYEHKTYSEQTTHMIDEKVNEILNTLYMEAKNILVRRSEDVHLLAKTIRQVETLDRKDIDYLLEHRTIDKNHISAEMLNEIQKDDAKDADKAKETDNSVETKTEADNSVEAKTEADNSVETKTEADKKENANDDKSEDSGETRSDS